MDPCTPKEDCHLVSDDASLSAPHKAKSNEGKFTMAKVTGIGGVFIKAPEHTPELAKWYAEHLGFALEDWGGAILKWEEDTRDDGGLTVWNVASHDSKWFAPSASTFMINYRVDDLAGLLEQLRAADVEIVGGPESHENGDFAWVMDPAGNKVELWQAKAWAEVTNEDA